MKKDQNNASYYRLHTDAVEELISATAENTPKYSQEELDRFRAGRAKRKTPAMLKAVLLKAWFYGAVCFFVFWGLGLYVWDQLDLYVVAAVVMGLVTDLLINSLLRFGEKKPEESRRLMMVTMRGVGGLMLNLLYAGVLLFFVVTAYSMINALLLTLFGGGEGAPFLGVEPILFGLFAAGADMLLIACKHLLMKIAADARRG